jgi:hypothetical protein
MLRHGHRLVVKAQRSIRQLAEAVAEILVDRPGEDQVSPTAAVGDVHEVGA